MPESPFLRWFRLIRPQDFVWVLLFLTLAATSEFRDSLAMVPLAALGLLQLLEPKVPALTTRRGRIGCIVFKLVLGYLVIGYTGAIESHFWLVLLLPVVTAAATFGLLGTLVVVVVANGFYLSFLLYINWTQMTVEGQDLSELVARSAFVAMAGILANSLAEDLRVQSEKHRRTAEHLAEANRQVMLAHEAVRRSDKLAALGQLTAGLAHELRNPLGTIKASAEMLNQQLSAENEVAREVAGFISTEVDRTNSLVTRFLQFARPLKLRMETADLAQLLDRAITDAEREAPGIAVYRNYALEIPPFPFDAELMERVFYNLVLNAAQATAAGGAVTVKTRAQGSTAEIAVIDRGVGIGTAQLKDIFNPFFTTKPDGVGLGLAIVAKIVDEHGGKIAVESEPGKGSIFCVSLPMEPAPPPTPRMKKRILIVEDEEKLRRVLELQLMSAGFDVSKAATAEEGLKLVDRADMVLTDLKLPRMDGQEFLGLIRSQNAQVPVVMMTAYGSVETAVEAMKAGATDFLLKPFSLDHLMQVVNKALEVRALRDENRQLKEELGRRYEFDNIIGRSPSMQEIFAAIERVGPTRATVLLTGESGVGKDLIARAIHFHSPRKDRPLVKINCSALPENLMESELFGYEKGAFTGAQTTKPGKFEQADTGTVFLDEIGDVPAPIQVKLLRVLQEREFERLGSNVTRHIDIRLIAATNQDLRAALEQGTFREDLYYRLNVVPLNIPPLRERKVDIPSLANHFVRKLAPETGCQVESITSAAMEKLVAYHWPGNVRELENVIERSLVMASGTELDVDDIKLENAPRPRAQGDSHFLPEGLSLDQYEQDIIKEALRRADGNKSQAARLLGLTRNALRYRLTQMGLES